MPNTKRLLTSLILTTLIALGGCFPGVYKIDIQQGNVVTQDMIDELRPGMSKSQVRYIMGNPLITDTFHARRWDYLYSMQTGSGKKNQKRMSLYFNENEQLIAVSGDFRLKPGNTRDEAILGAKTPAQSANTQDAVDKPKPPVTSPAVEKPRKAEQDTQQAAPRTTTLNDSPKTPEAPPKASSASAQVLSNPQSSEPTSAAKPSSVEEQIQRELDAAQPSEEVRPDSL